MTFTVENLEFFLAILVRITGFIQLAPFFSLSNIPQRAKLLMSGAIAVIVYFILPYEPLVYGGVLGYTALVIKEALAGMMLGMFANLAYYILQLAGQLADMEIGLSMLQQFDPANKIQSTITSSILNYAVLLTMVATNLHLYILRALIDSFTLIPVGKPLFSPLMYEGYLAYLLDYMILAFRIVLPVFAALLVVNVVLAVLAKAAPQMNMFVIGFQLKIFVGLAVITLMILFLPGISDLIFNEMMDMVRTAAAYLTPS